MQFEKLFSEWPTFILLPTVIGIAANLLTPMFRSLLTGAIFSIGRSFKVIGRNGVIKRIAQLEEELNQANEFIKNPVKFVIYVGHQFSYQFLILWSFVILYGVIFLFYQDEVSDTSIQAQSLIPAMFGAGGIQAFISTFTVWNIIGKMNKSEEYMLSIKRKITELNKTVAAYNA